MKKTTQTLVLVFSTLLLLVSVTVSACAQNLVKFAGVWNTVTDKGEKLVISLQERSSTLVDGSYSSLPGMTGSQSGLQTAGRIKGTMAGDVLRFTWRQDDGGYGAGRFTLSSDGQSFEGTFSTTRNPDDTSGGTWKGTRRPYFGGIWQAKLGEGALELILQQTGDQVTGQVKINSAEFGIIRDGIVVWNTLRFKIMRPGKPLPFVRNLPDEYVGNGELVMDAGWKSFTGNVLGIATSGTLVGVNAPSNATTNPDDISRGTLNGTRASSFAGAWRGKFGDGGFELVLQQSGSDVAGQLNINSVIYVIREGRVDANNTLRFLVVRPRTVSGVIVFDHVLGTGELVMDAGGKSFKGKILNVDASGTFIGS